MAASLKSIGPAPIPVRSRPAAAPGLTPAPRPRIYLEAHGGIPGALPAYAWLAAGLCTAAASVIFLVWLALALSRAVIAL